jgi:hypothetical protein
MSRKKSKKVIVELEVDLNSIECAERFLNSFGSSGQSAWWRAVDREISFALLRHLVEQSKVIHP